MRKYIGILFSFLFMVSLSCKDVEVYYPIPLQSKIPIVIDAHSGIFDQTIEINTADFSTELKGKLKQIDLKVDDVEKIVLEGAALVVVEASEPGVVINDSINIRYQNSEYINLMYLQEIDLDQIMNIPQANLLSSAGVTLFNSVLDDIKNSRPPAVIFLRSKGTLISGGSRVNFKIILDLTITTLVKKKAVDFRSHTMKIFVKIIGWVNGMKKNLFLFEIFVYRKIAANKTQQYPYSN